MSDLSLENFEKAKELLSKYKSGNAYVLSNKSEKDVLIELIEGSFSPSVLVSVGKLTKYQEDKIKEIIKKL